MIHKIEYDDLPLAAAVIRESFATVAAEFGITRQNGANHTAFLTVDKLQNHFHWGWQMYGYYHENMLVGYVSLSKESDTIYELHNFAVLPAHRRNGYGKMLLDFCKTQVLKWGCNQIHLSMIEENTRIKNFYSANGFVHVGTKKFEHLPFVSGYMEWHG